MRSPIVLLALVTLLGCGDDGSPGGDAAPIDAAPIDAAPIDAAQGFDGPDGDFAGPGEICGTSDVDLDAGARTCAPGLICCYPCGIADCADRCTAPCTPGPGCQTGGCPGPFP